MIFYRIVKNDPPSLTDFTSSAALGRPVARENPEVVRLHSGISVFATLRQATNHSRQWPVLGEFIATLDIPLGSRILAERTTHRRGHHTLWGSPNDLLAHVIAVAPAKT